MAEPVAHNAAVAHSEMFGKAAKESRDIEFGLLKILLTVDGGALTLSIGFILGERRVPLPKELTGYVEVAWGVLVVSMTCAVISWIVTSLASTAHAGAMGSYLSGKRKDIPTYQAAGNLATFTTSVAAIACVAGLALLAWIALRMVSALSEVPLIG